MRKQSWQVSSLAQPGTSRARQTLAKTTNTRVSGGSHGGVGAAGLGARGKVGIVYVDFGS